MVCRTEELHALQNRTSCSAEQNFMFCRTSREHFIFELLLLLLAGFKFELAILSTAVYAIKHSK
jgi:hypothetical protein